MIATWEQSASCFPSSTGRDLSAPEYLKFITAFVSVFGGRSLQKDVESDTSGHFKKFLSAILKADRQPDTGEINAIRAREDAEVRTGNWRGDEVGWELRALTAFDFSNNKESGATFLFAKTYTIY